MKPFLFKYKNKQHALLKSFSTFIIPLATNADLFEKVTFVINFYLNILKYLS